MGHGSRYPLRPQSSSSSSSFTTWSPHHPRDVTQRVRAGPWPRWVRRPARRGCRCRAPAITSPSSTVASFFLHGARDLRRDDLPLAHDLGDNAGAPHAAQLRGEKAEQQSHHHDGDDREGVEQPDPEPHTMSATAAPPPGLQQWRGAGERRAGPAPEGSHTCGRHTCRRSSGRGRRHAQPRAGRRPPDEAGRRPGAQQHLRVCDDSAPRPREVVARSPSRTNPHVPPRGSSCRDAGVGHGAAIPARRRGDLEDGVLLEEQQVGLPGRAS